MKRFSPIPRSYLLELGAAMLAYGLVLCTSIFLLKTGYFEGTAAALVALLPTLPCIAACWAILRRLRRLDEQQLRVHLEALAFAFCGTALLTFSYGFLEGVGWRPLSMFAVWPLMAVLWVIGGLIATRRYR